MARKTIREIRHDELIEATIRAAHRHGFSTITLADVAGEAGMSAASVNYHFKSKEQLMMASMRRLLTLLHAALLRRLADADSPHARIHAIVAANFDDTLFTLEQCSIWMQFWAAAPYAPALARLHHINRRRVRSNFRAELRDLLPPQNRDIARRAIQAYMDGVWTEAVQRNRPLDPAASREEARLFVDLILGSVDSLVRPATG